MAANTYLQDIPSVRSKHPLVDITNVGKDATALINQAVFKGDPLHLEHLSEATGLVKHLKVDIASVLGDTTTLVQLLHTAQSREVAIRSAHSAQEFSDARLQATLNRMEATLTRMDERLTEVQTTLTGVDTKLVLMDTKLTNDRYRRQNESYMRESGGQPQYKILLKEVVGSGVQRARDAGFDGRRVKTYTADQLGVGNLFPDILSDADLASGAKIAHLICFYNDNFGIDATDDQTTGANKYKRWLQFGE